MTSVLLLLAVALVALGPTYYVLRVRLPDEKVLWSRVQEHHPSKFQEASSRIRWIGVWMTVLDWAFVLELSIAVGILILLSVGFPS